MRLLIAGLLVRVQSEEPSSHASGFKARPFLLIERCSAARIPTYLPAARASGPVASFFCQDGAFGQGEERKVSFKTIEDRHPDLEARLIARTGRPEAGSPPPSATTRRFCAWAGLAPRTDGAGRWISGQFVR
jgi:hypothetical protein